VNGGFELDTNANQIPDSWKLKHATGDKLKCNSTEKPIAFEGACAFQFKGGEGERSKLRQEIDLTTNQVMTGDTLTLSGQVWAKGAVDSKVTLKVKYPSLPTDKVVVEVVNSTGKQWTPLSALQSALSLTIVDTPSHIKLQLKNSSAFGKIRYDALSILWQTEGTLRGVVLPLP
jgi:hypothetical protein